MTAISSQKTPSALKYEMSERTVQRSKAQAPVKLSAGTLSQGSRRR
jgi:hypothetical protein